MFNIYPWQQKLWQLLTNEVKQNRLAHALLLHGASGLGKRDFARAFSRYVLCECKTTTSAVTQRDVNESTSGSSVEPIFREKEANNGSAHPGTDLLPSACGECKSCQWFQAGTHPYFFSVGLEEKSKAIKIDQLRELTHRLEKTSHRGHYQIAVIESADTMNRAAANALLKTLEEPSECVVILLVADRLKPLPAT